MHWFRIYFDYGTYKNSATKLLQYIQSKDNGQRLNWDVQGPVTLDGQLIEGGNIVDLVNDALRHRKNTKAAGRENFARYLHQLNTPREFVGNTSFWKPQLLQATSTPNKSALTKRNPGRNSFNSSFLTEDDSIDESMDSKKKKMILIKRLHGTV